MFPDLKRAKNFHCSRTKTMVILKKARTAKLKGNLCDFIKVLPYEGQ